VIGFSLGGYQAREEAVMAKRFYTVLILPDATAQARKFHITRPVLTAISSVMAVSVLAFAFFLSQYVNLNVRMLELKQLRQEAGDRSFLAAKVGQLEGELSRLRDLDRKLRVVAGLDSSGDQGAEVAQGGAEMLSRTALLDAVGKGTGRLADWVTRDLEALGQEITSRERSFRELKNLLEEKRSILASSPTIWPVKGMLTAGYGYRESPFTGKREMHEGLDVAAAHGTPIVATADGVVSFTGPWAASATWCSSTTGTGSRPSTPASRFKVNRGSRSGAGRSWRTWAPRPDDRPARPLRGAGERDHGESLGIVDPSGKLRQPVRPTAS
jgi:hypothetical protein